MGSVLSQAGHLVLRETGLLARLRDVGSGGLRLVRLCYELCLTSRGLGTCSRITCSWMGRSILAANWPEAAKMLHPAIAPKPKTTIMARRQSGSISAMVEIMNTPAQKAI